MTTLEVRCFTFLNLLDGSEPIIFCQTSSIFFKNEIFSQDLKSLFLSCHIHNQKFIEGASSNNNLLCFLSLLLFFKFFYNFTFFFHEIYLIIFIILFKKFYHALLLFYLNFLL